MRFSRCSDSLESLAHRAQTGDAILVDGCVENSRMKPSPVSSLMMNRCAVAGFKSDTGVRFDQVSSLLSAEISGCTERRASPGLPGRCCRIENRRRRC